MSLMIVEQVAAFIGVQNERVERLVSETETETESLLPATEKDANESQVFEKISRKYKVLAERLRGLKLVITFERVAMIVSSESYQ